MLLLIWLLVATAVICLWLVKKNSYWKKRGVNNLPPVPLFGNMAKPMLQQEPFATYMMKGYNAFPNDRFYGSYELLTPTMYVKDPELIRLIGVKDFDYFIDRTKFSGDNDTVFSKSLIGLRGQKWRNMRSTLSPAFTGSKLKSMVPLILECNKELLDTIKNEISHTSGKYLDIDTQDLLKRYTNDVIATCAFGLKTNSIKEKENDFFEMGKKLTKISTTLLIKSFLVMTFPFIEKFIEVNLTSKDAVTFLSNIVLRTMKNRNDSNIFRPDIIQILMEAKKGTLKHEELKSVKDAGFATVEESNIGKDTVQQNWNDKELVAQALLFFFAGFDTVSSCLKLLLLELAINTDVQDKLLEEINEHNTKYQGKIDYDKINEMKYMDMVVTESLRKWPPGISIDRECHKPYSLGKANKLSEKEITIEKGIGVSIPIYCIHHDPKYYPNPEKFDPERFSEENVHNITPFTYMPFGIGPRNCIGSRFALVEVKAIVYELVRQFELSPAPQTVLPPRFANNSLFSLILEGGHYLRFKNRI